MLGAYSSCLLPCSFPYSFEILISQRRRQRHLLFIFFAPPSQVPTLTKLNNAAVRDLSLIPCGPGFYCPSGRDYVQQLCERGTFQDLYHQTSCKSCPVGYECPYEGMITPVRAVCWMRILVVLVVFFLGFLSKKDRSTLGLGTSCLTVFDFRIFFMV
jgi:hypothetical protein